MPQLCVQENRGAEDREQFLHEMNCVVSWADLVVVIEAVYPKAEGLEGPPVSVERMLRLHCLQQWLNLSDPAVQEALYDSRADEEFAKLGHIATA